MKILVSCRLCSCKYDEAERCPLILQCGHGCCKTCLSKLLSKSPNSYLPCPFCRQVTYVGNSVESLTKNFAVLDVSEDEGKSGELVVVSEQSICYVGCSRRLDIGLHGDLRLGKRIGGGWGGGGGGGGVETWEAVLGRGNKCKHNVVVKKVVVGDDMMDFLWLTERLEELRKKTMWCTNVCAFHGVKEMEDGSLGLVMDRYVGSVRTEMQKNNRRLTLDQILRYGIDITRGVVELHAAGVVCMNINPSNLLLDASDRAVLSDYGLPEVLKTHPCQKARPENASLKTHSCIDCTMLIPNYSAPEAWEPVKKLNVFQDESTGISPGSDSWSFGCTLIEMCTGIAPWMGLRAEAIRHSVVKAKKQPPQYAGVAGAGIPTELWKMIGECLRFKASKRPTFSAMLAIFNRHLQETPSDLPEREDKVISSELESGVSTSTSGQLDVTQDGSLSLFHRLVSEGNVDGVREFLASNGGNLRSVLETRNTDGQTALHLACRRGSLELLRAILHYKEANVDILDKDGDPPLVFALASGSPECVRALIRRGADVKYRMRRGHGPSVSHVCAYHGHPDCMDELLLGDADPNAVDEEGDSVLHRAVSKNFSECAIIILERGGCKSMGVRNLKQLTPLHLCVDTWNVAVVQKWVELASTEEIAAAIEITSSLGTPLCMAAALRKGHEPEGREIVRILLAAGANPAAQDTQRHSRTALHIAAMINDPELARVIIDAGVDVNIRNKYNTIPLHIALAKGAYSCVELLLSAGGNYNMQDDEGCNAFHIAASSANMVRENLEGLVVMLRNPDAAVGIRNNSGKTLQDLLEALPREWISEDLTEALSERGVHLSPTIYKVGDWVKFKRSTTSPSYGWQSATQNSVGFVRSVPDENHLSVSFCTGLNEERARVLVNEVVKVIALEQGQHVKLRPDVEESRFGWRRHPDDGPGKVLSVDDDDGYLRLEFPESPTAVIADPAEVERFQEFHVGDWVCALDTFTTSKHDLEFVTPESVGIVNSVRPDNCLLLDLNYLPSPCQIEPEEVVHVEPFMVGDSVCVKRSVVEPRYSWGGETHTSVAKISDIEIDGLLVMYIPNRPTPWEADPADMERLMNFKVGEWVRVKALIPSPKYGWEDVTPRCIGIIHSLEDDGDVGVAYCFRGTLFRCSVTDIEIVTPFEIGQEIELFVWVTQPQLGWSNETPTTTGKIERIDMDGTLKVKVANRRNFWNVSPGDAKRLPQFQVGDWVRVDPVTFSYSDKIRWKESLAVVHSIHDTGNLELMGCSRVGRRFNAHYSNVTKVPSFKAGQHVRFREGLSEPKWGWRGAQRNSLGVLAGAHADGVVRVAFFGLQGLLIVDPNDLEVQDMFEVGDWVKMAGNATPWNSISPGSIGIVQGHGYNEMNLDAFVLVAFCGEYTQWVGQSSHLEGVNKLVVGQRVRVKDTVLQPRFGWSGHSHESVVTISAIDGDGKLRIRILPAGKSWMLDPSDVELVEEDEIRAGDWVRVSPSVSAPTHHWGDVSPSSIGVVYRLEEDGVDLWVAFCYLDKLWLCKASEMEKIRPFTIGDQVKIREGVVIPRWGWGMETHASRGEVVGVDANGKLRIKFQRRSGSPWIGDPADIVLCESSSSGTASIVRHQSSSTAEIVPGESSSSGTARIVRHQSSSTAEIVPGESSSSGTASIVLHQSSSTAEIVPGESLSTAEIVPSASLSTAEIVPSASSSTTEIVPGESS